MMKNSWYPLWYQNIYVRSGVRLCAAVVLFVLICCIQGFFFYPITRSKLDSQLSQPAFMKSDSVVMDRQDSVSGISLLSKTSVGAYELFMLEKSLIFTRYKIITIRNVSPPESLVIHTGYSSLPATITQTEIQVNGQEVMHFEWHRFILAPLLPALILAPYCSDLLLWILWKRVLKSK